MEGKINLRAISGKGKRTTIRRIAGNFTRIKGSDIYGEKRGEWDGEVGLVGDGVKKAPS